MRRFEREVQGRNRFWEVDLHGTTLVIRTGVVGRTPRERIQELDNPDQAAAELTGAVEGMVASGWVEVVQDAPDAEVDAEHAAVLEAPDDAARYLVLGDRLEAVGDPRGELVAVQAAMALGDDRPELRDREALLLRTHGEALLGPLESRVDPGVDWFCGYIRGLTLVAEGYGTEAAAELDALAESGGLAFLRTLRVVGAPQMDALGHAIRRRVWPVLTTLKLGQGGPSGGLTWPVAELLKTVPALEVLQLTADPVSTGRLQHPVLRSLKLCVFDGTALHDLTFDLPALRSVELEVQNPTTWDPVVRALDVPLDRLEVTGLVLSDFVRSLRPRTARLDRLVLRDSRDGPALVHALRTMASALQGTRIELRDIDVSDGDLADLDGVLEVETDLPDVAVRAGRSNVSPRQETPRRFERVMEERRFWQIVREGAVLRTHYGRIGHPGKHWEKDFGTAEKAASEYRKRLRSKRAEGWEEVG